MINLNNRYFKVFVLLLLLSLLFYFRRLNFSVVEDSLNIFLTTLVPSLFPFILFSNFATQSNLITSITKIFGKYSHIVSAAIIGFLCGYPMGAKVTYDYLENGKITKKQAKFLMSFINNCNPIFILSTVGICILDNTKFAIILFISHYLASIIIGLYYFLTNNIIHENPEKSNSFSKNKSKVLHKSIFDILDSSIKSSFIVLGNIFAYITIFNLIAKTFETFMLQLNINSNIIYILSCTLEVTNGIKFLFLNSSYAISLTLVIISFMLGFGGLSIIFQVYSCIYKSRIKLSYLIKCKFIHGLLSACITSTLLYLDKIYIFRFNNIDITFNNYSDAIYFVTLTSLLFVLVFTIKKVTQKH